MTPSVVTCVHLIFNFSLVLGNLNIKTARMKTHILAFTLLVSSLVAAYGDQDTMYTSIEKIDLPYGFKIGGEINSDTRIAFLYAGSGVCLESLVVLIRTDGKWEVQHFFESIYWHPGGRETNLYFFRYDAGCFIFFTMDKCEKLRVECPSLRATPREAAMAKARLGWRCISDSCVTLPHREEIGRLFLQESADAGCVEGMRYLGLTLLWGRYGWKLSRCGGKRYLGLSFLPGKVGENDERKALEWLRKAAQAGDKEAEQIIKRITETHGERNGEMFNSKPQS